jgi:hypothetical protein
MRQILIFLLAIAAAGPLAAQQVYKWVDKDGTVHFTDSPPPESVRAERRVLHSNVQSSAGNTQDVRGMNQDEIDVLYTPEQRKAACEQARANHTTLSNMATITVDRNNDGVVETLTEEEKVEELRRAQEQIQLLCTDDPTS